MADETMIVQFHVDVYAPENLPEPEVESARRVLDSERFRQRLKRVVRSTFRKHCALRRLRVSLSA